MRKKGSGEDFSKKTCNFAEAATEKRIRNGITSAKIFRGGGGSPQFL